MKEQMQKSFERLEKNIQEWIDEIHKLKELTGELCKVTKPFKS